MKCKYIQKITDNMVYLYINVQSVFAGITISRLVWHAVNRWRFKHYKLPTKRLKLILQGDNEK